MESYTRIRCGLANLGGADIIGLCKQLGVNGLFGLGLRVLWGLWGFMVLELRVVDKKMAQLQGLGPRS